jgi:ABC-type uncharacterized transport system permease subunit
MLVLFVLAALAYVGAAFGSLLAVLGDDAKAPRWPLHALLVAAIFHLGAIGSQCLDGAHPFRSIQMTLSAVAWFVVVGYLGLVRGRRPLRELGAMLAPTALVAMAVGFVAHADVVPNPELSPMLVRAHVVFASLGVAGFVLAAGVAAVYLALEHRLRHKEVPRGMQGLSVRGLDQLHNRLVVAATPVFALAMAFGAVALTQAGGLEMLQTRALELVAGFVAFSANLTSLVGRAIIGLRGRKAAILTLLAFFATLLIIVSYGVRS